MPRGLHRPDAGESEVRRHALGRHVDRRGLDRPAPCVGVQGIGAAAPGATPHGDPQAFEGVKTCPAAYLEKREQAGPVRVWVPGCACGEEAYPLAMVLCAEPRQRFVSGQGGELVIHECLRDCAVFASHNVRQDPPSLRLDLVSCGHTLIDFTAPIQERMLRFFSFSLLPGGLLVLGNSESLAARDPDFGSEIELLTKEPLASPTSLNQGW